MAVLFGAKILFPAAGFEWMAGCKKNWTWGWMKTEGEVSFEVRFQRYEKQLGAGVIGALLLQ